MASDLLSQLRTAKISSVLQGPKDLQKRTLCATKSELKRGHLKLCLLLGLTVGNLQK